MEWNEEENKDKDNWSLRMQIKKCKSYRALYSKTKMSSIRKERTGREEEEMRRGGTGIVDNKDKLMERKKRMKIFMDVENIGRTWY